MARCACLVPVRCSWCSQRMGAGLPPPWGSASQLVAKRRASASLLPRGKGGEGVSHPFHFLLKAVLPLLGLLLP